MTVKEHYDNHLGNFYSWMVGDFEQRKRDFLGYCKKYEIKPSDSKMAIDLGSGNGIQSIALAELGFTVKAIDFNDQLLSELVSRKNGLPIEICNEDIRTVLRHKDDQPELIVCSGDTIVHLESRQEIEQLIKDCFRVLSPKGKLILSFRDYEFELKDTFRFIPVKSDSNRILTCFLEYFPEKVRVTDLFYEKEDDKWQQKVSSYEKVRISPDWFLNLLQESGFTIEANETINRMISIIAEKISR